MKKILFALIFIAIIVIAVRNFRMNQLTAQSYTLVEKSKLMLDTLEVKQRSETFRDTLFEKRLRKLQQEMNDLQGKMDFWQIKW